MAKGFAKPADNNALSVQSMVASRTLQPAVELRWGKQRCNLSLDEARSHAYGILEAIAASELDSCLMRWLIEKIGLEPEQAGQMLMVFREKRQNAKLPSITLNFDGEHLRPETARQYATEMISTAFGAEMEALMVMFALEELKETPEFADMMVQEFREMRGATTMWPSESETLWPSEDGDDDAE